MPIKWFISFKLFSIGVPVIIMTYSLFSASAIAFFVRCVFGFLIKCASSIIKQSIKSNASKSMFFVCSGFVIKILGVSSHSLNASSRLAP